MTATPDLLAVKERQRQVWSMGNFAQVGNAIVLISERLCEAADVRSGERVLDVATGSGNTALAAARRFALVTGVDYVPALLEQARKRTEAELLTAEFQVGDAEDLPFPDASFDVVLSTFGCMFAPNQEKAAAELLRVTRPGGRIAMANWTPDSYVGRLFMVSGKHAPPPPGLRPPSQWGTEERLRELCGDGISKLTANRQVFTFHYPSPDFYVDFMRTYFGPTKNTFESLDAGGQESLATEIRALIDEFNRAEDGTVVIPATYLEVVAVRR